jgi:hypothetical protein
VGTARLAADPERNAHRAGEKWSLTTVRAILANPRYTGRQVWNRQPTAMELIDPGNTGLGHKQVQRWGLPDGWVISARPAHPALVSEEDFIAVQGIRAQREGNDLGREYRLAGLLRCGICGRRAESCWSNNRPAYRCRHGHSSASAPDPARPKNLYIREDRILLHLPALYLLLTGEAPAATRRRRRTRRGADVQRQASAEDVIGYLRARQISLTYDPRTSAPKSTGPPASVSARVIRARECPGGDRILVILRRHPPVEREPQGALAWFRSPAAPRLLRPRRKRVSGRRPPRGRRRTPGRRSHRSTPPRQAGNSIDISSMRPHAAANLPDGKTGRRRIISETDNSGRFLTFSVSCSSWLMHAEL